MRVRYVAALLVAASAVLVGCSAGASPNPSNPSDSSATSGTQTTPSSTAPSTTPSSATSSASTKPAKPVKVTSLLNDGVTVGVAMPIILSFSPAPTDSTAFTNAVKVTQNGKPVDGAWFWSKPYADQPIQAHYRPSKYWQANSDISVDIPIGGLSAGVGLVYENKLTSLDFHTGDAVVGTVDGASLQMVVTRNGQTIRQIPVSLGKASTPTYNGTKVVMQKGEQNPASGQLRPNGAVLMTGPGYSEIANWSIRLTADGEYLHDAPWNTGVGARSTSNGCTNLHAADAKWLFETMNIGDPVVYRNTGGGKMPTWDGYGDWNVSWSEWKRGGLLLNH